MTPSLVTLVIDVPGNPALSEIINHGLVPELMNLIGQTFLEPIRIPPLGLGSVQVAPPVIATGQGRSLATTALCPPCRIPRRWQVRGHSRRCSPPSMPRF
jgi:hypothetical protein